MKNEILLGTMFFCLLVLLDCGGDSSSNAKETPSLSSSVSELGSSSLLSSSTTFVASSSSKVITSSSSSATEDTSGICDSMCDSFTAASPIVDENGGVGSITTYGSIGDPETSQGGACNYGETGIQYYAAIHVNIEPGDNLGPWQGGKACGGCVAVRAKTGEGWKSTVVRITDKCPDPNCGVDLGGAPARDLMGIQAGRYEGEWEFISCEGHPEVFGDSTSLFVKEGSNAYWSVIQVRNPLDAVTQMVLYRAADSSLTELEWATEAENFFSVPANILQDSSEYEIRVSYRFSEGEIWKLKGTDLNKPEVSYRLEE